MNKQNRYRGWKSYKTWLDITSVKLVGGVQDLVLGGHDTAGEVDLVGSVKARLEEFMTLFQEFKAWL
jgi:hypothetical protein